MNKRKIVLAALAAMVMAMGAFTQNFPAYLKVSGTTIVGCAKIKFPTLSARIKKGGIGERRNAHGRKTLTARASRCTMKARGVPLGVTA